MSAPRIFYFQPYHPEGLGKAYNEHCSLVPNDSDWCCIMDSDVMFFSSQRMGDQLAEAIELHPDVDVFTCVTNRMCGDQQIPGPIRQERDLVTLKKEADKCYAQRRNKVKIIHGFFAGYFMFFPKRVWREIPFPEIGSQGGKILGIDSAWCHMVHQRGKKVGLLLGLMATHFYRLDKGEGDLSHLSDADHDQHKPHVWSPGTPRPGITRPPAAPVTPPAQMAPRPMRIMLNPNLRPSGGYWMESDGMRYEGPSAERVVKLVTEARIRQNKPVGNPMKELTEQIFARQPAVCLHV